MGRTVIAELLWAWPRVTGPTSTQRNSRLAMGRGPRNRGFEAEFVLQTRTSAWYIPEIAVWNMTRRPIGCHSLRQLAGLRTLRTCQLGTPTEAILTISGQSRVRSS